MLLSTIVELIASNELAGADAQKTSMVFLLNRAKLNWAKRIPTVQKLLSCTSDGLWILHVQKHRGDMPNWREGFDFLVQAIQKVHHEFEIFGGVLPTVSVAAHNIATILPALSEKFLTSCDSDDDEEELADEELAEEEPVELAEEEEEDEEPVELAEEEEEEEDEDEDEEDEDELFKIPTGVTFRASDLGKNYKELKATMAQINGGYYISKKYGIGMHGHPQPMVFKNGKMLAHTSMRARGVT
jgi:hypothetical protein